jgi:hypothetical protein
MGDKKIRITAGALAIAFFLIHAAALVHAGEHDHIIWSCHLGCLMVGIGLLNRLPWLYAIGFFWLTMGVPLWLLNVLTRHEYMLTSTLSHMGGIIIAVYGLRFIQIPRFAWAAATAGLVVLGILTRLVTAPVANVNLAFAVWAGWEDQFPSYCWYVIMLLAIAAFTFWMLEFIVRRYQAKNRSGGMDA